MRISPIIFSYIIFPSNISCKTRIIRMTEAALYTQQSCHNHLTWNWTSELMITPFPRVTVNPESTVSWLTSIWLMASILFVSSIGCKQQIQSSEQKNKNANLHFYQLNQTTNSVTVLTFQTVALKTSRIQLNLSLFYLETLCTNIK